MKAIELRIGNLVKDPYEKTIKLVSVERDASMLRPIELTEGWLIKFGFDFKVTSVDRGFMDILESYKINYVDGKIKCILSKNDLNHKCVIVNYVHQLQNLYVCLTGEELTIK